MKRRVLVPLAIYLICATAYVVLLGDRALGPTVDNHFVHLAKSLMAGKLSVGTTPPGTNDWALYDGQWYVSFPPFPALVIAPAVAIWGLATRDGVFWALCAALAPTLLYLLLRRLRESGESLRSAREDVALTLLFAFGTVYFFVAVQGTVWFAAHIVASSLLVLYLGASFGAGHPALAGMWLGFATLTRATTPLVFIVFTVEALRRYRRTDARADDPEAHPLARLVRFVRGAILPKVLVAHVWFAIPLLACIGVQLGLNYAMFDDPFAASHEFLQIRWRQRIEDWGLFNYHYFPRNLAIFVASLPWITPRAPHVMVSLHGLALWVTTPNLWWLPWPKWLDARYVGLALGAGAVAIADLCYQNSGWLQFGYRFALDYMPLLIVMLAIGRRRFGPGFYACMLFAIVVNTFGAVTFDRHWQFYDNDNTQRRLFQPD